MSAADPVVVALDSSTTATKAIAFEPATGMAVAEARREYPRSSPKPGWQEQDPRDWWSAASGALQELTSVLARRRTGISALGITHQRETFACLDADGVPLRPAILWLDTRAGEQIARLGSPRVHELSGKPPSTTPSLYKLAWLSEHEPALLAGADLVTDVHGYLVRALTGERATSWASADPMALVGMSSFGWDAELLGLCGVREEQLPQLVAPGSVIGQVSTAAAAVTGLPAGLPVVAGAGDGQCAGLGAGVVDQSVAYLNLGTGLTLGTHSETYLHSRAFRTLSSPIAGHYTLEALLSSGALSISWFRDVLSGLPDGTDREATMEAMAAAVPAGARGLLFLPYLTSAETPHWDADARAAFVGLSDTHGLPEMYRAVLEGLAYEERLSIELMEAETGSRIERIRALGGGARSALLTQLLADVLQRPVELCTELEATALGAAVLAAAAVDGEHPAQAAKRMTGTSAVRLPSADDGRYAAAYGVYRRLYPALRDLFPALSDLRTPHP